MTKKDDMEIQALEDRVEALEKVVVLLMASQPIWIGFEDCDSRFLDDWYKTAHETLDIRTRGIRD